MMYYLLDWYYHGEGDGATEEEDDGNPGKDENGDVDGAPAVYGEDDKACCCCNCCWNIAHCGDCVLK